MNKNAQRLLFAGGSGSGKSTQVKQQLRDENRVIVFDVMDEYGDLRDFARRATLKGVQQWMKKNWNRGFKVAYVPDERKAPLQKQFNDLCGLIQLAQKPYKDKKDNRQISLVVEEMNTVFSHSDVNKVTNFADICSRGRHYGINVYGVTQRIAEVATRYRGNCDAQYFFRQNEKVDLDRIKATCGKENADIVGRFEPHQYLLWRNGQAEFGKNVLS